jgi:hypothetical protein
MKFCVEILHHKHMYKFCMKYCVHVNSYKHGDRQKFVAVSNKCNVMEVCTLPSIITLQVLSPC